MTNPTGFSYCPANATERERNGLPYVPIVLIYQARSIAVNGLLDTGAAINVLPYSLGQQLGLIWEEQPLLEKLSGNLASFESRGARLAGMVEPFSPVPLVFAWTKSNSIPLILGQANFFQTFQVCFDGSDQIFTTVPKC
ncbi:hypothetical protein ACQ4M3_32975 [Leptolyngbya sp. AN03gr2]|uniref:hypothetical protein n=1 Tax=unclassified Leptolyngbya TaxID=2650499 RepID=UPI003D31EDD2